MITSCGSRRESWGRRSVAVDHTLWRGLPPRGRGPDTNACVVKIASGAPALMRAPPRVEDVRWPQALRPAAILAVYGLK